MPRNKELALVMPYYDNPGMLALHYAALAALPEAIRERMEVVIVDDGSPGTPAATVERPDGLPQLSIYRVAVDLPWHQHAARNIGANEARATWLMLTDMDHMLPTQTWLQLLGTQMLQEAHSHDVFTFYRVDAPDMAPKLHPQTGEPHPHPNTFLMRKEWFWRIGGYDEDFCGIYGTDGLFRKRLWAVSFERKLGPKYPIVRYDREEQADASTQTLQRKEGRQPGAKQAVEERKRREGRTGVPKVLSMPYKRAFP